MFSEEKEIFSGVVDVWKSIERLNKVLDDNEKLLPSQHGVFTNEDLIIFALIYLEANIEHAFERLEDL